MQSLPAISHLSEEDKYVLAELILQQGQDQRAQECLDSFYEFFQEFWHTIATEKLHLNFHVKLICDTLQEIGEAVIGGRKPEYQYTLINVPPGMSKSSMCSILFPAWLWAKAPWVKIITSSYSMDASLPHAEAARECMESPKYQRYYGHVWQFHKSRNAKSNYWTNQLGARFTTASRASITGKHAQIVIIDDPHNIPRPDDNTAGATPTEIALDNYFFWNKIHNRRSPEAIVPVLLIMQRLHDLDLAGEWIRRAEKGKLELNHIRLPATDEFKIHPPELAAQYAKNGGYLDPVRKPESVLKVHQASGSDYYAKQYGQDTTPSEGGIFKKTWWGFYDKSDLPGDHITDCTIDTALGDRSKTRRPGAEDPYGVMPFTVVGNKIYIKWFGRPRIEFPDFIRFINEGFSDELKTKYRDNIPELIASLGPSERMTYEGKPFIEIFGGHSNSNIYIENQTSGVQARQTLREDIKYNVIGSNTGQASKEDRAKIQSRRVHAGRVLLPRGEVRMELRTKAGVIVEHVEPWVPEFIAEVCGFPNYRHDEAVDCLEMACRHGL